MKKEIFLIMICIFSVIFSSCSMVKDIYLSQAAISNFKGTDAYKLSKAVMRQNSKKIKKICKSNPNCMYAEDKKYNYTVLHYAVGLEKYESAKALLEVGMNPNIQTSNKGETPLFISANYWEIDIKFMKLLIENGANPEIGTIYNKDWGGWATGTTPLMALPTMYIPAQKINMEKAKYLIEFGNVNINNIDIDGETAAVKALRMKDVKMAYYIIVELKADVTKPFYSPDWLLFEGEKKKEFSPVSELKDWWIYPIDSEEYKIKLEIIKEFERQGVDYKSVEPAQFALDNIKKLYPDSWEDYLEKY